MEAKSTFVITLTREVIVDARRSRHLILRSPFVHFPLNGCDGQRRSRTRTGPPVAHFGKEARERHAQRVGEELHQQPHLRRDRSGEAHLLSGSGCVAEADNPLNTRPQGEPHEGNSHQLSFCLQKKGKTKQVGGGVWSE